MIIDDEVPEEVTLVDELVFLEKSWYLEMFTRRGVVDKQGSLNSRYTNFQATPLRMMTRSKKTRLGSSGIPCVSCDKIFKSDKPWNITRKNSTDIAKLSSSWLVKPSSVELRLALILVITPHPPPPPGKVYLSHF